MRCLSKHPPLFLSIELLIKSQYTINPRMVVFYQSLEQKPVYKPHPTLENIIPYMSCVRCDSLAAHNRNDFGIFLQVLLSNWPYWTRNAGDFNWTRV